MQFNEDRSVQALQNARAEILTLSQATASVEERFGKYRAEKVSPLNHSKPPKLPSSLEPPRKALSV
jgi:hypothetical protein